MATTKTELINTANGNAILATNTSAPFDSFSWDSTGVTGSVSLAVRWYVDNVLVETSDAVGITVNEVPVTSLTTISNYPMTDSTGSDGACIDTVGGYNGTPGASIVRNGTRYEFVGNDSSVTFTDVAAHSVAGVAFEIEMKVEFKDLTNQWLVNKRDNSNKEYQINLFGGAFGFKLFDGSNAIGRTFDISGVMTTGTEYTVIVGHDGSNNSSGLYIKVDGVRQDDTDDNSGTYTGMVNTVAPLLLGRAGFTSGFGYNGYMRDLIIRKAV